MIASCSFETNFKSYFKFLESEHFELDLRPVFMQVNSNNSNPDPRLPSETCKGFYNN